MAITEPRARGAIGRLVWFVGLWLAGVAAVGALALGLRLLMRMAGFHT